MTLQEAEARRAMLLELAERCEKATGPDRMIDALVTKHFRLYRSLTTPIADDRWIELREADGRLLMHVPGDVCAPYGYRGLPFSSSLDAAMSLVPENAFWRLGHDGDGADPSEFRAQIIVPMVGGNDPRGIAIASTPALALTAAALRARASQEQSS